VIQIDIANQQRLMKLDRGRIRRAACDVLSAHDVQTAEISIAIVDDEAIHELNRRWLQHDYPTDVLSFVLEQSPGHLEGEVIASSETAQRSSAELGVSEQDELLLYIIHGMLHLVGFDDQTKAAASQMREEERKLMARYQGDAAKTAPAPKASRPGKRRAPRVQR
jgi:probable rRNA maturation factor